MQGLFALLIATLAGHLALESAVPDPHYTVRAWRAVVTYLLRQEEFLYE